MKMMMIPVVKLTSANTLWSKMAIFFLIVGILVIKSLIEQFSTNNSGTSSTTNYRSGRGNTSAQMGEFEIKANLEMRGKDKDLKVIAVECRGLMPVYRSMEIDFIIWAEDITDNSEGDPIFCSLEDFQHPENSTFQCVRGGGSLSPNQGFSNWVEIGIAPLDTLTFPKEGTRKMKIYGYLTEKTTPSLRKPLVGSTCQIQVIIKETGYKDWTLKKIEALILTMRLGVAMAHIDGNFADSEALTIKNWLKERVNRLNDDEQAGAKSKLNAELKKAVILAREGSLNYNSACHELKGNTTKNASFDALELCTMVMAADGIIDKSEFDLLRKISNMLDIPSTDLQTLRDKHTANAAVRTNSKGEQDDELLIDLDTNLPVVQIRKKLLEAFGRYNDMLTVERDPAKRKRYQECIEAIARLRKKYG